MLEANVPDCYHCTDMQNLVQDPALLHNYVRACAVVCNVLYLCIFAIPEHVLARLGSEAHHNNPPLHFNTPCLVGVR
jgi:hypothetical protein